jgi:hypothetical protein
MNQIRTPEGYQTLGTSSAFTASGAIAPGTTYASMNAVGGTTLDLPAATAIGGSLLVFENLSATQTVDLNAAAGETINGAASVTIASSTAVLVVRSGADAVRAVEL